MRSKNVTLVEYDLPTEMFQTLHLEQRVAVDIETSGLKWQTDRIGSVQLYAPMIGVVIVRAINAPPSLLSQLLELRKPTKVFHHAMFDLRFMTFHWGVKPKAIQCTKILAKLLSPNVESREHSLKSLLNAYLYVSIDKSQQSSDWMANSLSGEQIHYAAEDVRYLLPLLDEMKAEAQMKNLWHLAQAAYRHIPTRVNLDLLGYSDPYSY